MSNVYKISPHSVEAEQSVLGAILLDKNVFDKVLKYLSIDGSDFYMPVHRTLFQKMYEIHAKDIPVDVITLDTALEDKEFLKNSGGFAYIVDLVEAVPTVANVIYYASEVKKKSIRRHIISLAADMTTAAYEQEDVGVLVDNAQKSLGRAAVSTDKPFVHIGEVVKTVFEELEELSKSEQNMSGISTGFTNLDERLGGFQNTDLIIVAGRPSMGKTALTMQIAAYQALRAERKVGIFSIEVGRKQLLKNIFACQTKINTEKFKTASFGDAEWERLSTVSGSLIGTNIYIDEMSRSIMTIVRQARAMKLEHGLDIIYIDHLQLLNAGGRKENRAYEVAQITGQLKNLAKELEIPVVLVSQLNRGLVSRDNKKPNMADLKESGAIEQDADVILFIHRDEYYNGNASDEVGQADIIISKQRNGITGAIKLKWNAEYIRFENLSWQDRKDI